MEIMISARLAGEIRQKNTYSRIGAKILAPVIISRISVQQLTFGNALNAMVIA